MQAGLSISQITCCSGVVRKGAIDASNRCLIVAQFSGTTPTFTCLGIVRCFRVARMDLYQDEIVLVAVLNNPMEH